MGDGRGDRERDWERDKGIRKQNIIKCSVFLDSLLNHYLID